MKGGVSNKSAFRAFWVLLSIATLIGALCVCFVAYFFTFEFQNDEDGRTIEGVLLAFALLGLISAFGMLIQSIDGRGRPGRWLGATLILCAPLPTLLLALGLS